MKFSPKVDITGLKQEVFKAMRLCEAICANYNVEMFIPYVSGPQNKFAITTKNMRAHIWHIFEDITEALTGDFVVEDKFENVVNSPQIVVIMDHSDK